MATGTTRYRQEYRMSLDTQNWKGYFATMPKKVITELEIVDTTDKYHPVAIPYTFVLDRDRTIYKIYNGWWYVGRPTVEELRMDLRALMSRRQDWWYDKTSPP